MDMTIVLQIVGALVVIVPFGFWLYYKYRSKLVIDWITSISGNSGERTISFRVRNRSDKEITISSFGVMYPPKMEYPYRPNSNTERIKGGGEHHDFSFTISTTNGLTENEIERINRVFVTDGNDKRRKKKIPFHITFRPA